MAQVHGAGRSMAQVSSPGQFAAVRCFRTVLYFTGALIEV